MQEPLLRVSFDATEEEMGISPITTHTIHPNGIPGGNGCQSRTALKCWDGLPLSGGVRQVVHERHCAGNACRPLLQADGGVKCTSPPCFLIHHGNHLPQTDRFHESTSRAPIPGHPC
jgi:hypothetical protein